MDFFSFPPFYPLVSLLALLLEGETPPLLVILLAGDGVALLARLQPQLWLHAGEGGDSFKCSNWDFKQAFPLAGRVSILVAEKKV